MLSSLRRGISLADSIGETPPSTAKRKSARGLCLQRGRRPANGRSAALPERVRVARPPADLREGREGGARDRSFEDAVPAAFAPVERESSARPPRRCRRFGRCEIRPGRNKVAQASGASGALLDEPRVARRQRQACVRIGARRPFGAVFVSCRSTACLVVSPASSRPGKGWSVLSSNSFSSCSARMEGDDGGHGCGQAGGDRRRGPAGA
jgi:hypothetical protein